MTPASLAFASGIRPNDRSYGSSRSSEQLAGDEALDAPADRAVGLAFGLATGDVRADAFVVPHAGLGDVVPARLRAGSPPRLSQCRMVLPQLASSGLAPARAVTLKALADVAK